MKNILYQESIVEIKHLFRMMRNTLLALFVFAGTAFATESYSQTMKVTVVADNVSTGKVISEIEKQTDYLFVYNVNEVNLKRNVKVNAQNKSVAEVILRPISELSLDRPMKESRSAPGCCRGPIGTSW